MLLGRFAVRVGGQPVPDAAWRHKRAAELVKILALADAHQLHSEQVIDLLWPDLTPEAAAGNLRKAVHFARAALGDADAIGRNGAMLELCPGGQVLVDALAFEAAARAGRQGALGAYQGDLLPDDRYALWAEEPRERLRALHLKLLKTAGLWERVLDADPADEDASQVLMQRAIDAGDRRAALRQFERLREHLRTDLGIGPDQKSVALYEGAIAMGGPNMPTTAERARALLARGLVQLNTGDLAEAERTAHRARALAMDAGLGHEIGEAGSLLGILANLRGEWTKQFRAEFIAGARAGPEVAAQVFDAHLCLAEACLNGPAGHGGMAEYVRDLHAVAEQAGSVPGRALAEYLMGELELLSGRLGAAHQLLSSAAALYERAGATSGQAMAMHRIAEVALTRGQRKQAISLLQRSLRVAERCWLEPHAVIRILGTLVAATANPHAAVRRVEDADRMLDRRNVCAPCSIAFRLAAAIAYARAGHLGHARPRLEGAERIAGMWPGGSWQAATWEAHAVLREVEGDIRRAAALYDEAADRFADLGRPLDRDRCHAAAQHIAGATIAAGWSQA